MNNFVLEELVLTVILNGAKRFKNWVYEGLQELGKSVLTGLNLNAIPPLLSTAEKDRIICWYVGVII